MERRKQEVERSEKKVERREKEVERREGELERREEEVKRREEKMGRRGKKASEEVWREKSKPTIKPLHTFTYWAMELFKTDPKVFSVTPRLFAIHKDVAF